MVSKVVSITLKDLVEIMQLRKKRKSDFIIAITGKRGLGKSTLGFKILKLAKGFKPKRDIVYDLETFKKHMTRWDSKILVDETIYVAYKRDWMKEGQKELMKQLNVYRDHRNFVILCIPNFWDLDKPIRDLIHMRIDVIYRKKNYAKGVVHLPSTSQYTQDFWDAYNNLKKERDFIVGKSRPKYHKLSTFTGYIKFKKLTEKQEKMYQQIKNDNRNLLYEKELKETKKSDIYESLADKLVGGILTKDFIPQFCAVNNLDYNTVYATLNKKIKSRGITKKPSSFFIDSEKSSSQDDNKRTNQNPIISKLPSFSG